MEVCDYCGKESDVLQMCLKCEKAWFCSDDHLSYHKSSHESPCVPFVVQSEEGCGRYWIASRNIAKGELIYSEKALVVGPSSECATDPSFTLNSSFLYPTCLGCCRITNTSYRCSKCHWPMCSKKCEKNQQHAEFECKIFRKIKIPASTKAQYYLYIQLLRSVLLRKVDRTAFDRLISLEPHVEGRANHKEESRLSKLFYNFLIEECHIDEFDFEFVDRVVGVNRINSYSADIPSLNKRKRTCTALFFQMSLMNHTCCSNTRTVVYENSSDLSINLALFAAVNIWKGQSITQQYIPAVQSTRERRKALKEWYFECNCKRCSDPTEFGTYYSCLKCPKCPKGFICPENSLDEKSHWKCCNSTCNLGLSCDEVRFVLKGAEEEFQRNRDLKVPDLESALETVLSRKYVHIHHHLAINFQYDIIHEVVKNLNNERDIDHIRRASQYCRNILEVVDVICPGFSYYRGVILYFLANCLFALHEMTGLDESECKISVLLDIIQEGIDIMKVEPQDSRYSEMKDELETFQKTLLQN